MRLSLSAHYSRSYASSKWSRLTKKSFAIMRGRPIRRSIPFFLVLLYANESLLHKRSTFPLAIPLYIHAYVWFPFYSFFPLSYETSAYTHVTVAQSEVSPGVPVESIPPYSSSIGPSGKCSKSNLPRSRVTLALYCRLRINPLMLIVELIFNAF